MIIQAFLTKNDYRVLDKLDIGIIFEVAEIIHPAPPPNDVGEPTDLVWLVIPPSVLERLAQIGIPAH